MLIVFGGLPGTGKTTLAREVSRCLSAVYLRIDTLEQAMVASGMSPDAIGPLGYCVGYAVARDNLRLGAAVIADSVNPLAITRNAWQGVAQDAGVFLLEIEVICSDTTEHRRRAEMREADILGHRLPSWQDVLDRHYDDWERERLVIDTALLPVSQAVVEIVQRLPVAQRS